MSKDQVTTTSTTKECSFTVPAYASQVPYVPVNWGDRDAIVARLMNILEAAIPEGTQLDATKALVKNTMSDYFKELFNNQYEVLTSPTITSGGSTSHATYCTAIWNAASTSGDSRCDSSNQQ